MPVSEAELTSLAHNHDIISIGVLADEVRRTLHGTKTTFVRVASVDAAVGGPIAYPPAAGELRITGVPANRTAAAARVGEVAAASAGAAVTGFSLADLEALSAREGVTLRALLEELRAAGLELVAEAPIDRLQDPRRSIEEVNIAGLALARLTVHQWPAPSGTDDQSSALQQLFRMVNALQRSVAVIRTFAPLPRRFNPAAPSTG